MDEKMLTAQELAELLGISVYTVHRMAHKEGGLKGYKVGNCTRFKPSDVDVYLAAHEIKAPQKINPFPGMERFTYKPGMKVVSL